MMTMTSSEQNLKQVAGNRPFLTPLAIQIRILSPLEVQKGGSEKSNCFQTWPRSLDFDLRLYSGQFDLSQRTKMI